MKVFERKKEPAPVNPETVKWAYRLFLDREPESTAVIKDKTRRLRTIAELRTEFMQSVEFKQANYTYTPALAGDEPRMEIEDVTSPEELQALFAHIQDTWQHLGEVEPHWSVLSANEFLASQIHENLESFYASGMTDINRLYSALERSGIEADLLHTCLEYGCGLGRVTRWLAQRFEVVYGYDISKTHLRAAGEYLNGIGIHNIQLSHVSHVNEIKTLPKVDLVYSVIVLQHNPPPLIALMIREFIRALNPGGVAYFQLPTYRKDYSFTTAEYLKGTLSQEIEMHVLPQKKVFEIVQQEGGRVIEVIEDGWTGGRYKELSNTFLIQKGTPS